MKRYILLLVLGSAMLKAQSANARALSTELPIADSSTEEPKIWSDYKSTEATRRADRTTTVELQQPKTIYRPIYISHADKLKPQYVELESYLSEEATEAPIAINTTEPTARKPDHTTTSKSMGTQPTTESSQHISTTTESITEATTTEYHPISIGHADEYKPRPFEFDSQLSAQLLKILVTNRHTFTTGAR